jgi:hypothetical protein
MPDHNTLNGTALHEDKRTKEPVRAASISNITIAAPGSTIDGVSMVAGDRVLLKNQATASQNGIYVWSTAVSPMTRAADADSASEWFHGFKVFVREGTTNAGTHWTYTTSSAVTLGATSLAFSADAAGDAAQTANFVKAGPTTGAATIPSYRALVSADMPANPSFSGTVAAGQFFPGSTGAAANTRYVGGTASVAPTTGTFATGDFVITQAGSIYICTASGSPGTWTAVSGSGSSSATLIQTSNLLFETVLTSTTASISIPTISQNYRDLRIQGQVRGTAASNGGQVLIRFNSDSTSGDYGSQLFFADTSASSASSSVTTQTSGILAGYAGANALANVAEVFDTTIPNYTGSTYFKSWVTHAMGTRNGTALSGVQEDIYGGIWLSTAAITSINLFPDSGSFAAGTVVRVYGEPSSAGGSAVGTGTRLRIGSNQSIPNATATLLNWDTEDNDADNQHYTSSANLTGTVSKTASSTTLTGSSTLFTSELSVGQVISVPGTVAEKRVVTAIASDTSLTVNSTFVNTASGQTATRVNSAVVFRQSGFYTLEANIYSAALASGTASLQFWLNSLTTATSGTTIGQIDPTPINASAGYGLTVQRQFAQWDFVEVVWTQTSSGSVNVTADERTHFSVNARSTVIAAVPYAKIVDSKAQNTAGGTFTSGADRTRDLNLIEHDDSHITSISSNQFTLQPGTYRYWISAPAQAVDQHQALLYNATSATTVKRGTSELAAAAASAQTRATVSGRMTVTTASAFEVRHRGTATKTTDGFGTAGNFGAEIYTMVEIWKEG